MATFWDLEEKQIDLGDGNTVTIRKLTFADMAKIWADAELFGGPEQTFQQRFATALTKQSVIAWSGPGFEGRGVSKENIDALPWRIVTKISEVASDFSILDDDTKNASSADTK